MEVETVTTADVGLLHAVRATLRDADDVYVVRLEPLGAEPRRAYGVRYRSSCPATACSAPVLPGPAGTAPTPLNVAETSSGTLN